MQHSANIWRSLPRGLMRLLQHSIHSRHSRWVLASAAVMSVALIYYAPHTVSAATQISAPQRDPRTLYAEIFIAQDRNDFTRADHLITQLSDQRLMGYVLAERYLNPNYKPSTAEITAWLSQYADHPQSREMLAMAERLHAQIPANYQPATAPLSGAGSNLQMGRGTMPDGWYHGLRLWKQDQFAQAAPLFLQVAHQESLNDWQQAAGAYWAYRSYNALHQERDAAHALKLAAKYPDTFYGMLATATQGEKLHFTATLPEVPENLWQDAAIARAQMLTDLNRNEEAEAELRQRYTTLNAAQRVSLIGVAAALDLPNLQMRLAQTTDANDAQTMAARYPLPAPMLHAQHTVHPALLMAVAMQESGFREEVKGGSGAMGMMQMMPSTAQRVAIFSQSVKLADNDAHLSLHDRLNDMAMSTRLGAAYFTQLSRQPAIGQNAIYQLAAYNAGPGTVAGWQKMAHMDDPLLFLESIPYPETHNYVMQVMAHMWVYQVLLGKQPRAPVQLAHGQWPTMPVLPTAKPAV